jgi:hypothetical protein
VLQLATRTALDELASFISSPTPTNASQLVSIPSIYDILKLEHVRDREQYKNSTLSLCKWIHDRGRAVLRKLLDQVESPIEVRQGLEHEDWRSVSVSMLCIERASTEKSFRQGVCTACLKFGHVQNTQG